MRPYDPTPTRKNPKKWQKKSVKKRFFLVVAPLEKSCSDPITQPNDKMVTDNFDKGSEDGFEVTCNIVSVLPRDYD